MNLKISSMLIGTTLATLLSASSLAQTVKIGIATEPYPPFSVPDAAGN